METIKINNKINKIKCFGGIIKSLSSGKYLLVKGFTGKWSFPKGHKENNELPHECATREIYEETGLKFDDIQKYKLSFVSNYYYYNIILDNECETNPIDTNEIKDIGWFSPEEAILLNKNKDVNVFFSRLLNKTIYMNRINNKKFKKDDETTNKYLCIIPESINLQNLKDIKDT
jgi:hypothetical protein